MQSKIRFSSFPRTKQPPEFVLEVIATLRAEEGFIGTAELEKGLTSDALLAHLRPQLVQLGFQVENSKLSKDKIKRPVFFGENGAPGLQYEIDAFHPKWKCGLELEAGRAWMGNAVYRDLIQAAVMVDLEHLLLVVPNSYRYVSGGRRTHSKDYENTVSVADALFAHDRVRLPYGLTVIGY